VREAAHALESLGHSVVESHPAALDRVAEQSEAFMAVVTSWSAAALDEWQAKVGADIGPDDIEFGTRALAEAGRALPAPRYIAALKWIARFTREVAAWWTDGFDLLLTPTLAVPPPEIGALGGTPDNPLAIDRVLSIIPYTPSFNLTGQPALSLPLHWTPEGLPVGVQLVAAYGREDLLLRVAGQLERARPWRDRRPPIHA
jgi:amidase